MQAAALTLLCFVAAQQVLHHLVTHKLDLVGTTMEETAPIMVLCLCQLSCELLQANSTQTMLAAVEGEPSCLCRTIRFLRVQSHKYCSW